MQRKRSNKGRSEKEKSSSYGRGAEVGKSIRKARRSFAIYKTKMTSFHCPYGTSTASRIAMKKVIYDFYSDLFDSHIYLPAQHLRRDEDIAPPVLPFEICHVITR
uniref:Uncharacterized protein n=1 Tax=Haemonchus contortus TaxID=6289 RepID=A0A7I4YZQ7_HAECO